MLIKNQTSNKISSNIYKTKKSYLLIIRFFDYYLDDMIRIILVGWEVSTWLEAEAETTHAINKGFFHGRNHSYLSEIHNIRKGDFLVELLTEQQWANAPAAFTPNIHCWLFLLHFFFIWYSVALFLEDNILVL